MIVGAKKGHTLPVPDKKLDPSKFKNDETFGRIQKLKPEKG